MEDRVPGHLVGDRWRALRLIARGGMGAVYEAQHHLTGERFALKMLLPSVTFDPGSAERFKREVSYAAAIGHEGIPRVLDAGADAHTGGLYFVMELLHGETLADRMARAPDSWDATRIIAAMLEPLAAAHAKGIVHRDLKPQNVFVTRHPDGSERVCLLDLGIARQEGEAGTATITRAVIGSPGYMAPEQAKSARGVSPAADSWAVGVMLYQVWATTMPFHGETNAAVIVVACTEPHASLATIAPHTPPGIVSLVDRCLAKNADGRPRDASDLRAALLALLGQPVPSRRVVTVRPTVRSRAGLVLGAIVAFLVVVASLAVVGEYVTRDRWRPRRARPTPAAPDAGSALASLSVATAARMDPDPPRLVGPLTGSLVTSHRPTLRFARAPGATSTRIELCRDRGCTEAIGVIETADTRALPPSPLPRGVVFWRARSLVGTSVGARLSATWTFTVPARSAPRGTVVLTYPDLDGDGLSDVAAGMPAARTGQGNVRAFTAARGAGHISRQADGIRPPSPLIALGTTLSHAGDVDGDGFADIVAGAPDSKEGAGAIVVNYGSPAVFRHGYALIEGVDRFGRAVAGVGDMDADGYGDIAIASSGESARGSVLIALGSPRGPRGASETLVGRLGLGEQFGASIAAAGDVNGDGYADLVVGAPGANGGNGRIYIVHGHAPWASLGELDLHTFDAPEPGVAFGSVVAGVGDLDGDGHADVAVGAPDVDAVYFLWGSPTGLVGSQVARLRSPVGSGVHFGASIAGMGDVDGNGMGEVVVGAWGHENERGTAYLFEGTPQGLSAVRGYAVPPGAGSGARFAWSLAGSGDVDGDGLVDLVVGAPGAAERAGRVYVVFGAVSGFADRPPDEIRPLEGGASSLGFSLL